MKKYYRFAGISLEICIPDAQMYENDRYLEPFRAERAEKAEVFQFEPMPALQPPVGKLLAANGTQRIYEDGTRYIGPVAHSWENAYAQVIEDGCRHRVLLKASRFPNRIGTNTVLTILGAEHLIAQNGGFIFHSAFIAVGGKAILFTAPSGTGKSTQAALWEQHRSAEIINGDRSAVRVTDGGIVACGIPFAGSSNICKNKTLPLAAIVYLKQAPENTIRRLQGAEGFCRIWEGCSVNTWDKADVAAVSDAVQQVACAVPVLELACTPDEKAVITLEEALKQEGLL